MSEPLHVEVSELPAEQIRAAEAWWRLNRPKAPNAIREELERASSLIALQTGIGTRARNATLVGVRRVHLARIHYDLYYRVVEAARQWNFWRSGTPAAAAVLPYDRPPNTRMEPTARN